MANAPKPLPFSTPVPGISERTLTDHHDKLYVGYVNKTNEIREKLEAYERGSGDLGSANATSSELRGLKNGEVFATNAVYLHEAYFENLGGSGNATGPLADALAKQFGSVDAFIAYMSACGIAARGWVVLAYDTNVNALRVYSCDAHDHGGIWGALPIIVLDVYEHAYFIDTGADRKTYIANFWKTLNWDVANERYAKVIG